MIRVIPAELGVARHLGLAGGLMADRQWRRRATPLRGLPGTRLSLNLAETARFELTGLSSSGFQVSVRAFAGVRAKQPRATYCRPEIASVGLTEAQAKEAGLPVRTGKAPFQAIAKAVIGGEYEGFCKVVAHAETSVVLGVHLIGPHATGLIVEPTLGMTLEVTAWEIGAATHPAPDPFGGRRRGCDGRGRPLDQLLRLGRRTRR